MDGDDDLPIDSTDGEINDDAGPSTLEPPAGEPEEAVVGGLFYNDDEDRPLKFHVQKHLGKIGELVAEMIIENGGQVLPQVPLNGYVLIDPTSVKGQKLLKRWSDPEKPDRHLICYTFVPASIAYGEVLSIQEMRNAIPLFVSNGLSLPVFLHQGLGHFRKQGLIKDITKYGGRVVATTKTARVIVADDEQPSFQTLVKRHEHSAVFIEPPDWVHSCIARKKYDHETIIPKAVGGRRSGAARQEYIPEDDQLLAEYIGRRIPRKDMRGRTGNQLYKELCERIDLYPWANRHTWESWRNRYKTKRAIIDRMIEEFVAANPQPIGSKGQYLITSTKAQALQVMRQGTRDSVADDEEAGSKAQITRPLKRRRVGFDDGGSEDEGQDAETMMRNFLSGSAS